MIYEEKLREYIEIARCYGYRMATGAGWLSGALASRCCCPMGAVVLAQKKGGARPWRSAWEQAVLRAPARSGNAAVAAVALRCSLEEVELFVAGFDGQDLEDSPRLEERERSALRLGRKFRAECVA